MTKLELENLKAAERISKKSYTEEVSKYDYTDRYSMKEIKEAYNEYKQNNY